MSDTPHWKSRRLARRAIRIQARRATESPAIKAFGATLVPKAQAFIAAYDNAAKYETAWKKEMNEGRGAVAELLNQIRSWAPVVHGDAPTLDIGGLGDKPGVPDDVILDAEKLLGEAGAIKLPNGDVPAYAADIQASLGGALQKAEKEWTEAEAADATYQALLANVRDTVEPFTTVLIQFRRTLAAVAGRQDKDFQKIRVERAAAPDEEDDAESGGSSASGAAPGGAAAAGAGGGDTGPAASGAAGGAAGG